MMTMLDTSLLKNLKRVAKELGKCITDEGHFVFSLLVSKDRFEDLNTDYVRYSMSPVVKCLCNAPRERVRETKHTLRHKSYIFIRTWNKTYD